MKISELTKLTALSRDIVLPISIAGQNRSITLGQIMDATATNVVTFSRIYDDENVTPSINEGADDFNIAGSIVFYKPTERFYLAFGRMTDVAGQLVKQWTFYEKWAGSALFYDENGNPRTDCLYSASNGRLYKFKAVDGLISAGLTDEQAKQLALNTPIEVASEEEMEQRIAIGEYEDGQFYFLAENE